MIPVTVMIMTLNEGARINACLAALQGFDDIHVIDSGSQDDTASIATKSGAQVHDFRWDGRYPKKRQWCLDKLTIKHDWVLFIDADEIMTQPLKSEITEFFATGNDIECAGVLITGRYVLEGKLLRYGLANRKIALLNKRKMTFVNDLDCPGMGEIEGHYQPVTISNQPHKIISFHNYLEHHANDDRAQWLARHQRYARWEACMNKQKAWPRDPVLWRQWLKVVFRTMPCRGMIAFVHSYIVKRGFKMACDRRLYYRMISNANKGAAPSRA